MSAEVFAARVPEDALASLMDNLWPAAMSMAIVEGEERVHFAGGGEQVQWAMWPRGRAFGESLEIRWERDGEAFDVTMIRAGAGAPIPPGFEQVIILGADAVAEEKEWYYLWGEREMAIEGRLEYAAAIPHKGRAQAGVVRYTDHTGRLILHRYSAVRREPVDGRQASS